MLKQFCLALLLSAALTATAPAAAPVEPTDAEVAGSSNAFQQNASEHGVRLTAIIADAKNRIPGTLGRYCEFVRTLGTASIPQVLRETTPSPAPREQTIRDHLADLAEIVFEADSYAEEALNAPQYDKRVFHKLMTRALDLDHDSHSLAVEAVELITRAWSRADVLIKTREDVLSQYQDEIRKGVVADGTRLAWSLIRIGASHPSTRVVPGTFRYDKDFAGIRLSCMGSDVSIRLDSADLRRRFRAEVDGYAFRSGWAVLFQKPLAWMVAAAKAMASAGVPTDRHAEWEVMEAPEGLIALAVDPDATAPLQAFYRGALRGIESPPPSRRFAGRGDRRLFPR